ncbi:MAG: 50S ribosomal protein L30 [Candidatus ainarchaeum sp.]|nr:50S ribosomal protein L30 [Candidatus ainarchaeum sp.]
MLMAIIRVRGPVKIKKDIEKSMTLLNLTRANHCVVYNDSAYLKGSLKKAKDYVTWGEVSKDVLKKLLVKRGYVYTADNKLISFNDAFSKDLDKIIEEIFSGKKTIKELNIKPVFRLKPPSKGYDRKGIKKTFVEGGALGYRKEEINKLLKKML